MDILIELLLAVMAGAGEILFWVVVEFVAEFLQLIITAPFRSSREVHPFFAVIGYLFYGAVIGVAGFLLVPKLFDLPSWLRMANLVITPIVCGLSMQAWGKYKADTGKMVVRLDSFAYGFIFALAMVGVRYVLQSGWKPF